MSFGSKILEKYGWEEGKGIGKQENGMVDPIKVKNKQNKLGVGATQRNCKDETLFSAIYDSALNGTSYSKVTDHFEKQEEHGKFCINFDSSKHTYHNGVTVSKEVTLGSVTKRPFEHENSNSDTDSSMEMEDTQHMTVKKKKTKVDARKYGVPSNTISGLGFSDAELFEFCRGRTCHPIARLRIKSSGKLSRIAKL